MHERPEPPPRLDRDAHPVEGALSLDPTEAQQTVEALIGDIVHVFRNVRPGSQWPRIAKQVLDHHTPPVDERTLDEWYRELQRRGRRVLDALISTDLGEIEDAIVALRLFQGAPDIMARHDEHRPEIVLD